MCKKKKSVLSGAESRELADGQRQSACRFNLPVSQASNFHVRISIIQCPALSKCERATVADDKSECMETETKQHEKGGEKGGGQITEEGENLRH